MGAAGDRGGELLDITERHDVFPCGVVPVDSPDLLRHGPTAEEMENAGAGDEVVLRIEEHVVADATVPQRPHLRVVGLGGGCGAPQSGDSARVQGREHIRLVPEGAHDVGESNALAYGPGEVPWAAIASSTAGLKNDLGRHLLRDSGPVRHRETERT